MDRKLEMFLRERDRARARGDWGVDRSITADLRRWGIPDDATLTHPTGKPKKASERTSVAVEDVFPEKRKPAGRPKQPRCEHGSIADRCPECNEELLAG